MINYKITPITDKLELKAVSSASTNNGGKFKKATSYINEAIDALSKKPEGDYNVAIYQSTMALASLLREFLNVDNKKLTPSQLIDKLKNHKEIREFITEPMDKFVGIIRNKKYGFFHADGDDNNSSKATFMEAKYVLVMSCNFLNYIKSLNT